MSSRGKQCWKEIRNRQNVSASLGEYLGDENEEDAVTSRTVGAAAARVKVGQTRHDKKDN